MMANSVANQGSIFHWARDHRVHHKYSETQADPHDATRGFFYAHMGWLFVKKEKAVITAGQELDFSDLVEDPIVMFQKKLDPWFTLYMCYVMPAQVASYFWGEKFWNAFFVAGALRYAIVLHFTWCVNSAAHLYGDIHMILYHTQQKILLFHSQLLEKDGITGIISTLLITQLLNLV